MKLLSEKKMYAAERRIEELERLLPSGVKTRFAQAEPKIREERALYRYLWAALPWSDCISERTPAMLLDYLQHGLFLYETSERVRCLPEDMFLEYVLQPRVNNERLEPCRQALYKALSGVMDAGTEREIALAVNDWCGAQAAYAATDARTAAVSAILRAAKGRCGEETVLAVHALRSVGLAARQVYVPRWAHTDDNHAWVEVYCDNAWHYLGACEPEEVLDRGWFTKSAARAMMVHARRFTPPDENEHAMDRFGMAWRVNRLSCYAQTKRLTVQVCQGDIPCSGAAVTFFLLNGAEFSSIAVLFSGPDGKVSVTCGYGTLLVQARLGAYSGTHLAAPDSTACTICLQKRVNGSEKWKDFVFAATPVSDIRVDALTDEVNRRHDQKQKAAMAAREEKLRRFHHAAQALDLQLGCSERFKELLHKAYGNTEELIRFISQRSADGLSDAESIRYKENLVFALSEKDLYDVDAELLETHYLAAIPFREGLPETVFCEGVLSPRIGLEELTDWRSRLRVLLEKQGAPICRDDPKKLWQLLETRIRARTEFCYPTLLSAPADIYMSGIGSKQERAILFVALCRTLGIPAKLRDTDAAPLYFQDDAYHAADSAADITAELLLESGAAEWHYGVNWSLARETDGVHEAMHETVYETLNLHKNRWRGGECLVPLCAGAYRLITTNRLPGGTQLASARTIVLEAGSMCRIPMRWCKAEAAQMLQSIRLPDLGLQPSEANEKQAAIRIWLSPAEEPSAHILNELCEQCDRFAAIANRIWFILPEHMKPEDNHLMEQTMNALKGIRIAYDPQQRTGKQLAREMFLEPEVMPFVLLTNASGDGSFAVCGYNVGTVAMLERLWALQAENTGMEAL